jgi:hypothetical protein
MMIQVTPIPCSERLCRGDGQKTVQVVAPGEAFPRLPKRVEPSASGDENRHPFRPRVPDALEVTFPFPDLFPLPNYCLISKLSMS